MKSVKRRFNDKWIPEPNSGCWLWVGCANKTGYGRIALKGKKAYAHRLSWEMANGPIPDGMNVLHRCDVPACVNPEHLFLGTQADNMSDMTKKGRRFNPPVNIGEENKSAKLTEADVIDIRNDTRTHKEIAGDYGVSRSQVGRIKNRTAWAHVMDYHSSPFHDGPCCYALRVDHEGAPGMWREIREWICMDCGEPTPDGSEPPDEYKYYD